jgi:hypothetical protein
MPTVCPPKADRLDRVQSLRTKAVGAPPQRRPVARRGALCGAASRATWPQWLACRGVSAHHREGLDRARRIRARCARERQRAACNTQHATGNMQHATCNRRHATDAMHQTIWNTQQHRQHAARAACLSERFALASTAVGCGRVRLLVSLPLPPPPSLPPPPPLPPRPPLPPLLPTYLPTRRGKPHSSLHRSARLDRAGLGPPQFTIHCRRAVAAATGGMRLSP